jgi:hypothetical protein
VNAVMLNKRPFAFAMGWLTSCWVNAVHPYR